MIRAIPALMLALAATAACAGRAPQTVAVVQDRDRYADCSAVMAEIRANNDQIGQLGREDGGKVAQNVAAGVAGVFIPVLWFAMDFQDASGKEGRALSQRNQYLATLAAQRCGHLAAEAAPPPAAPARSAAARRG
jgi:hypothetical protein